MFQQLLHRQGALKIHMILESCCEHPQTQTRLKIRANTSRGNPGAPLCCAREPALLKADVTVSTWDWMLRIKQTQHGQVGNTQHLSSKAGMGRDQLPVAELSHTCTEGSSLGWEPHPRIRVLRGEAAFSLVMQRKSTSVACNSILSSL